MKLDTNNKRLTIFGLTQQLSPKYWHFDDYKGYKDSDVSQKLLKNWGIDSQAFLKKKLFQGSSQTIATRIMKHIAVRLNYFLNPKHIKPLMDLCQVAMILHDKDQKSAHGVSVLKKPHIHIYCRLQHRITLAKIAKIMGVKPQYIDFGRGRYASENMQAYLVHADDDSKYQYSPSSVCTFGTYNYQDYYNQHAHKWKLHQARQSRRRHHSSRDWLIKAVQKGSIPDKNTLLKNNELAPIYADNMKEIDDAFQYAMEHKSVIMADKLKHHKFQKTVIYVDGMPGTGKTVFCLHLIDTIKKVAKKLYGQQWTSYIGSTKNPFDDYNGQDIVLLDDARSHTLSATDWLKLMDPVMMPRVSARYHNKFMACRVIIINSYQAPFYLFSHSDMGEDLSQFMRRITEILTLFKSKGRRLADLQKIYKLNNAKNVDIGDGKASTQYVSKIVKELHLKDALQHTLETALYNNVPDHKYFPKDKPNISQYRGGNHVENDN